MLILAVSGMARPRAILDKQGQADGVFRRLKTEPSGINREKLLAVSLDSIEAIADSKRSPIRWGGAGPRSKFGLIFIERAGSRSFVSAFIKTLGANMAFKAKPRLSLRRNWPKEASAPSTKLAIG